MSSTPELAWFTSSYSSGGDGDCVEVALSWRKSSYSSGSSGDCIEIAACPTTVHIRDSKDKGGPQLAVPAGSWAAFVTYAAAQGR
ncbi:DUF397 domain-containing protein [Streptomyces noursei]|uniref:DUF397 domain-containing protein n=1 Tax=Streptomyces noursei TaxID=1971 RepID=UPI00167BDE98|nr:DUF397 domain-containing protein [Streptomyces noursei]MCZ1015384.1 DUF397 domain-containing protein [Streptomyces noursei]GGX17023.1 toxin [Streptomyces noursei]